MRFNIPHPVNLIPSMNENIPDSRLVFSVENMHKINTIIYQSNRPQIPNVELFFLRTTRKVSRLSDVYICQIVNLDCSNKL